MEFTIKQGKDGKMSVKFGEHEAVLEAITEPAVDARAERLAAANLYIASSQAMSNCLLTSAASLSGSFAKLHASTARAITEIYGTNKLTENDQNKVYG